MSPEPGAAPPAVEAPARAFRPCVLVPVYDNATTVATVVREAKALGYDVLVVDDGSRDGSGERGAEAGGALVRHEVNRGKGAALRTGFREALARGFTHAVSIDADGQHFAADVPALLESARAFPDALVVGARDFSTQIHVQSKSSFGRRFSNFWVWFETGVRVDDSQCGLRVYPLAHVVRLPLTRERFDLEVEVIVRAAWAGLPVLSVPVRVHYPPPHERISHFDVLRDNVRISLLNCRLVARRFTPWPHTRLVPRKRIGLRDRVAALARESSSPLALGVAVAFGVVCGSSPFLGIHSLIALGLATLLRLNRPATFLGSLISTPPAAVPLYALTYAVGSFLLHGHAQRPDPSLPLATLARNAFQELLVGGLVVGAALGLFLGAITFLIVRARRRA